MIYWVEFLHFFLIFMIFSQMFEYAMIFMHSEDALSLNMYSKCILFRHLLAFASGCVCAFCFWGIYNWTGHRYIQTLVNKNCTQDSVLKATFEAMQTYVDSAQSPVRKGFLIGFLALILLCNIASFMHKKNVVDKICQGHENDSKRIKEPLLDKS